MITLSPAAEGMVFRWESVNQPGKVPPGDSGVTVGYGVDLGRTTVAEFEADWGHYLIPEQMDRLKQAVGKRGEAARVLARHLGDILISEPVARAVFRTRSLPKYARLTEDAFAGIDEWPAEVQGALFSLVFNRGPSLDGPRRVEMREIADAVRSPWSVAGLKFVAAQLRSMKRLWITSDAPGLVARREDEARLVESAIRPGAED